MKVMVIVKATVDSEKGILPEAELLAAMGKYNEELVAAGIMLNGDGVKPTSEGVRVHFSGDKREVVKGPFGPVTEQLAGFWIWEVKDLDEAIAWVKKAPNPMLVDSDIEIRPFYTMEDFASLDPTGEIMAREAEMRKQLGEV